MSGTSSQRLPAGRVGRPHGVDGSFHLTDGHLRLLALGISVSVGGRTARVARLAGTPERPIVRLEGVDDRAVAEAMRGLELTVSLPDAPSLPEGEWWAHELEGCSVGDGARELGRVVALLELPSCEALEVRRLDGGRLLVPMVRDAIRNVDVRARRIEVDVGFLGESEGEGGESR